jgi:hypothetical protein
MNLKRPTLEFHICCTLFWRYIYESEAADSWIPHSTYVLLNKPMLTVDALTHMGARQGKRFIWGHGKASVSFLLV